MIRGNLSTVAVATAAALAAAQAPAQEANSAATEQAGGIAMELNNLQQVDAGCRVAFVVTNETDTALDSLSYEVAVFDGDGALTRMLVLPFGELPQDKTRAMQFDLTETQCADVSRVLVNAVTECSAAEGDVDCLGALSVSNRTDRDFGM